MKTRTCKSATDPSDQQMDSIFHKCHGTAGWFTIVRTARDEPRRYGKNGELLLAYDETEEHQQRQASVVSGTDKGGAAKVAEANRLGSYGDAEKGHVKETE